MAHGTIAAHYGNTVGRAGAQNYQLHMLSMMETCGIEQRGPVFPPPRLQQFQIQNMAAGKGRLLGF
jgi:hypothetical protein